ncbi:MAG: oxidoreductase [Acetobacteraceae bacterium]|nr:oxidoreductase [Acetobacteraceae bacterium]
MITASLWLAALGPLALLLAFLLPATLRGVTPKAMNRIAGATSLATLAVALVIVVAVCRNGQMRTLPIEAWGVGVAVYLDAVSATMFCLVAFIGVIVMRYSATYMDGDPRQVLFVRLLCLTLSAVLMLAIAGNLFEFAVFFWATAMGLHRLLIFYPERPAAIFAARKKYFISRIGDLSLIVAIVLLYRAFGSLDYATLFAQADVLRLKGEMMPGVSFAVLCLVIAALLKSAQFPSHGWLIEVMETPTPVSALLHAGIINAGGFLVVRFADLVSLSLPSMHVLALIGGFTALFGSVVMLTQTSIKVQLTYSTVAQMGFMMLECGLGAFSAAMLHILAHSFYKAHAFLSSGSVIDIYRTSFTPSPGGKPHPLRLIFSIGGVLAVTLIFSIVTGYTITAQPGVFTLAAVLLLSLMHLVANGIDERPNAYVVIRVLIMAVLVAGAYFALQYGSDIVLAAALPKTQPLRGVFGVLVVVAVVGSYAAVTFLQGSVPKRQAEARWQAFYAHVNNGFYVNTWANRLVLRYWSGAPPAPASKRPSLSLRAGA